MLSSSLPGHAHDGVDVEGSSRRGMGLGWKYEPGSGEEQRERLEAFEFVVTARVVDLVGNAEERAGVFKGMVVGRWEKEVEMGLAA